ncbi:putative ubiquitin hydrolase putative cysteine peptidase Clan CA family C19 [Leptomonas seymouri]|uniref:Putative ubiquitin hydrolase putative cysteine peptidase Clan CA family C19 n=1 Tax=Leptomonas seymouri TaxID=5684 RepID=A0A0N1IA10_LEPSE|nr:putative ubiquitin hydrolase putative cysteine peptidase Clan CA family C19 [Leptomonas seymouri]|eukprot:KPI90273.1 putative ubiquitin hydrolase putative cysteine peptidase Clan CA family C19 [Leptomonas seymouri]
MSRRALTRPTEPQSSSIPSRHSRSRSELSATTLSAAAAPVSSEYSGSLWTRRPAAGAMTVQKRRFRTQSSTVGQGTRKTANRATEVLITCRDEGTTIAAHSCKTGDCEGDRDFPNVDVAERTTTSSSSNSSNSKSKFKDIVDIREEIALPKVNSAGPQAKRTNALRFRDAAYKGNSTVDKKGAVVNKTGEHGPPRGLSATVPLATSSSSLPSSHVAQKPSPTWLNQATTMTAFGVKETIGELPSCSSNAPGNDEGGPPQTLLPAHKRRTGDTSSGIVDNSAMAVSGKHKACCSPPVTSPVLPSATLKPVKSTESTASASLSLSQGSKYTTEASRHPVNNDALGPSASAASAESHAPSLSPTALSYRSPDALPSVESMLAPVALPRVSSQLPVQQMSSQQSPSTSLRALETPLQPTMDPAASRLSSTAQLLKPLVSAVSPRLQPHPPAALPHVSSNGQMATPSSLHSVLTLPSTTAAAAATASASPHSASRRSEKEHHAHHPPHCIPHLEILLALSKAHKPGNYALSPAIIKLHHSPISMRNFGSTCYLNSMVQCLLHTPGLLQSLDKDRQRIIGEWEVKKGGKFDEAHRRSCAERNAPATSALLDLGTMKPKQDTPTSQLLLSLKAACGECNEEFTGNGQNDAHEFLITLLGVIDKEVCRSKPEAYQTIKDVENECKRDAYARWTERLRQENNSTIYDFFGGVTGSTVQCAACSLITYRFEALLDVSLPMAYNCGPRAAARLSASEGKNGKTRPEEVVAVDLLLHDSFFSDRGEFLSGPMQVTCDRCKRLCDKTIWSTIEQWPPILVLHLKRFNNAGVKNESAVIFPYTFCPYGRVKYQLYGVCCHRGTASFGHYTSYVLAESDAATVEAPQREPGSCNGDSARTRNGDHTDGTGAFCSPPTGSFACSSDHHFDLGEKCDLPYGKNTQHVKTHGSGRGGDAGKPGKWYFCNDESITTVTASEVVSKTKEAYVLFYRRSA